METCGCMYLWPLCLGNCSHGLVPSVVGSGVTRLVRMIQLEVGIPGKDIMVIWWLANNGHLVRY